MRAPLPRAACQHGGNCAPALTRCGGCGAQKNKYRSLKVRTASTLVLIGSFFAFIWAGHVPLMLMIFGIQARGPPSVRTTPVGGRVPPLGGAGIGVTEAVMVGCWATLMVSRVFKSRRYSLQWSVNSKQWLGSWESRKLAPCLQHWQKMGVQRRGARGA